MYYELTANELTHKERVRFVCKSTIVSFSIGRFL